MNETATVAAADRRYQRWMLIFAALFLISAGTALLFLPPGGRTFTGELVEDPRFVLSITLITTLISLAGFVSTTWLAWRKERREAASYRLQVERQQLEIERLRLELEKERGKTAGE